MREFEMPDLSDDPWFKAEAEKIKQARTEKRPYEVSLVERVKELLGAFPEAGPDTLFSYTFDHGYETYRIQNDGEGSTTYHGSYHPNIVCEDEDGNGSETVCRWCGRTLM